MERTRVSRYFVVEYGVSEKQYNFQVLDTLCGQGLTKSMATTRKMCNNLQSGYETAMKAQYEADKLF